MWCSVTLCHFPTFAYKKSVLPCDSLLGDVHCDSFMDNAEIIETTSVYYEQLAEALYGIVYWKFGFMIW